MLSKKKRLTKKEFDAVFQTGKRIHSPALQLIYKKDDCFHGAAVVGKKVYKSAVGRNRLRRRLYGVLYTYYKNNPLQGTFILIAKPALKDVKKDVFAHEVEKVLNQVR